MEITHGGDVFAIARERGWDWRDVADFSASINPLGPSPAVNTAICNALDRIVHYPEREPARLRRALADCWGVDEDQILLGNGATELIFFSARMLPEMKVTLAAPVFSEFHRAFPQAGLVHLENSDEWPRDGMLVVTRPANPTGYCVELESLGDRPLLIDESFLEFSGKPSAATLLDRRPQWLILRSLTKFYALPGLRIGALVAPAETVRAWKQFREPWQVNVLAEEAALAAVADKVHAERTLDYVCQERNWLLERLSEIPGTKPSSNAANFIYVRLDYPASGLSEYLLSEKILVRNCAGWPGLPAQAVRIAVRTRAENERLIKAWRSFPCA